MILLTKLLIAHFLGDYFLQPNSWVAEKRELKQRSPKLYYHVLIHLLLTSVLLWNPRYWLGILVIFVSHYLIDLGKLHTEARFNSRIVYFTDQVLHIMVIVGVSYAYSDFVWDTIAELNWNKTLLQFLAVALLTVVASRSIKMWISRWKPEETEDTEQSLPDAGSYIGIIERLFVFGLVVSDNIDAIGFLIAAKSVFRFGNMKEKKDRRMTEYILIGTLLSFGIAIIVALLYMRAKALL